MAASPTAGDLPDVNVWFSLMASHHEHHAVARHYWTQQAAPAVWFCRITQIGMMRLLGQQRVMGMGNARKPRDAWDTAQSLLAHPGVGLCTEPPAVDAEAGGGGGKLCGGSSRGGRYECGGRESSEWGGWRGGSKRVADTERRRPTSKGTGEPLCEFGKLWLSLAGDATRLMGSGRRASGSMGGKVYDSGTIGLAPWYPFAFVLPLAADMFGLYPCTLVARSAVSNSSTRTRSP